MKRFSAVEKIQKSKNKYEGLSLETLKKLNNKRRKTELHLTKTERKARRAIEELEIAIKEKEKSTKKIKKPEKSFGEVSDFLHRITPFLPLMIEDAIRTPKINKNRKYYVYLLINPISKKIFYIGKGSGDRMYQHEELAKVNSISNNNFKLYNMIKTIDAKNPVVYRKVFFTENETAAYDVEQYLIAYFGLSNLCNIQPGGTRKIL
ncbi:MAG: GIY-YIG nuclease family protein [Candidatus Parcubacteria bacterium]|nr:GIY-YIG nuclease family protein [Candidatus Parcubacteria bacterium]